MAGVGLSARDPRACGWLFRLAGAVEAGRSSAQLRGPDTLKLKEAEVTAEQRRLANFVDFIGEVAGARHSPSMRCAEAARRSWGRLPSSGLRIG